MKKVIAIGFILFFVLSKATFAQNKEINWITFEQLSDSLSTNPKKTIIFFHTDWCSYCKKMMKETFRDENIVQSINKDYYAVHFDAESTDSILFDNVILTNNSLKKKKGHYHQVVKLLSTKNSIAFPTTLLLDENFNITITKSKYLSIKELLNIL